MKCPECNFENDDESNFCVNCGNKLKIDNHDNITSSNVSNQSLSEDDEPKTIDYQYAESNDSSKYSSENLDRIFSENKFLRITISSCMLSYIELRLLISLNECRKAVRMIIMSMA